MSDSPSPTESFWRVVESPRWGTTKIVLLKCAILLAYCGGPLLITDHTKPFLRSPWPFALTFAPFGLIIFGAWSLLFWNNDSWDRFCVYAGYVGLAAVAGMDLYAVHFFLNGGDYAEPGFIKFGITFGALVTIFYLGLAMRRLREEKAPNP